jgi:hypothetical protein
MEPATSQFKGVTWVKRRKKWSASYWDKALKKKVHLGQSYATEEDAARAYRDHDGHATVALKQEHSSRFKGVSWDKKRKRWYTRYWDKAHKKEVHLGYFATEEDAARAYQDRVGAKESVYAAAPAPAAAAALPAGQPAAQQLTQYELEREANIARNKARMAHLSVVGLAGRAGLAPEQPRSPPPPPPHRPAQATQAAAARASTTASKSDCADAGAFNVGANEEGVHEMQIVTVTTNAESAAALEVAAMEAQIEALEATGEAAVADFTAKAAIAVAEATAKANVQLAEANAKAALAEAKAALAEKRLANAASALG